MNSVVGGTSSARSAAPALLHCLAQSRKAVAQVAHAVRSGRRGHQPDRQTTRGGGPIQSHDPTFYVAHPEENDLYWRMIAANEMNYVKSMTYALIDPAKNAFGPNLRGGAWAYYADSRAYPEEPRPGLYKHWKHGTFGLDLQVPATYFGFPYQNDLVLPAFDPDPRWNLSSNWRQRLSAGTISETQLRYLWYFELFGDKTRAGAFSCDKPVMPSTTVYFLVADNVFATYGDLAVEAMVQAASDGASEFWMWNTDFNMPGDSPPNFADRVRDAVLEQAIAFNRRVTSIRCRRNAVSRRAGVSIPFLTSTRP